MTTVASPVSRAATPSARATALRWLVSFAGFPLGGLAAMILIGPVDGLGTALLGGAVTGVVLGSVQGWSLRRLGVRPGTWAAATGAGLAVGLGLGASVVDYRTGLGDLVLQGAVCGAVVGLAQAAVVLPALGRRALAWPAFLALAWSAGWAVTTSIDVQVGDRFTVFGSSGALVVTLLTVVLPLALRERAS